MQWPFLEPITFALTISTTFDHRPARVPQVPVEPLLSQHGDERGEHGDRETRVHETGDRDNLARWGFLGGRDHGGLAWNGRLIESKEDGTEEGCRLLVRVGLELRMDVDDEG